MHPTELFAFKFCPNCGVHFEAPLWPIHCDGCQKTWYANAKACVEAVLITEDNKTVVAIRAHDPGKGKLDIPGGFMEPNETAEEGLARELKEELGLTPNQYSTPEYVGSAYTTYNYQGIVSPIVALQFKAHLKPNVTIQAQDDVAGVTYLSAEEIIDEAFSWPDMHPALLRKTLEQ